MSPCMPPMIGWTFDIACAWRIRKRSVVIASLLHPTLLTRQLFERLVRELELLQGKPKAHRRLTVAGCRLQQIALLEAARDPVDLVAEGGDRANAVAPVAVGGPAGAAAARRRTVLFDGALRSPEVGVAITRLVDRWTGRQLCGRCRPGLLDGRKSERQSGLCQVGRCLDVHLRLADEHRAQAAHLRRR